MALHTTVPSETEATSFLDLVNDSREVAGALDSTVIDLTATVVRLPLARLPLGFGAMPVEITEDLLVTVDGIEDY